MHEQFMLIRSNFLLRVLFIGENVEKQIPAQSASAFDTGAYKNSTLSSALSYSNLRFKTQLLPFALYMNFRFIPRFFSEYKYIFWF